MKKRGFTLAEVLVAVGIIAIAAATLGPLYMNMRPDKYKIKVLKYYNLIDQTTGAILSNPLLYYRQQNPQPSDYITVNGVQILDPSSQAGCNGLACTLLPDSKTGYVNSTLYTGDAKYPNLMAGELPLENVTHGTGSTPTTGTLADRSSWTISGNVSQRFYDIVIDLDSAANSPDCPYDPTNCRQPDRFIFRVNLDGDVSGVDRLTQTYIRNITGINKAEDFAEASQ